MNQYSTVAGTIIVERDNFVAVWIAYTYNTSLCGELAISACSRCLDVRRLFIYFLLPISARSMVRPTEYCSTVLDTLVQKTYYYALGKCWRSTQTPPCGWKRLPSVVAQKGNGSI